MRRFGRPIHPCPVALVLALAVIVSVLVSPEAFPAVGPADTATTHVTALQSFATRWRLEEDAWRTASFYAALDSTPNAEKRFLVGYHNGELIAYSTFNLTSATMIKTSPLWPGMGGQFNLTGSNALGEMAIWDGGYPNVNHQEFLAGSSTRIRIPFQDQEGDDLWGRPQSENHPLHCSGTLIASGVNPQAHGMSPAAYLDSYFWDYVVADMSLAAMNGLLVSSNSWGRACGWYHDPETTTFEWWGDKRIDTNEDYKFGNYILLSAQLDSIACEAPFYVMVWAAGNDRDIASNRAPRGEIDKGYWWDVDLDTWVPIPDCPGEGCPQVDYLDNGFDTMSPSAGAKNVLAVGSLQYSSNPLNPDVVVSAFSSFGPTDDGRIKPDVVAMGENVVSCWYTELDNYYLPKSGTSMACPAVAGSVNLLVQQYKANHNGTPPRSSTVRGLVIHTATSKYSSGAPDYRYGWGTMNTSFAAELIQEDQEAAYPERIQESYLTNQAVHDFYVYCDGTDPLIATVAWTDPAGPVDATPSTDPSTLRLVNDLDIRLTYMKTDVTYAPFVMNPADPSAAATTGDNVRDNVEKIVVVSPAAGYYHVTVSHKGTLLAPQAYSLIVSGADYPGVARYENKSTESELDYAGTPYSSVTLDYDNDGKQDLMLSVQDAQSTIFRCWRVSPDGVPEYQDKRDDVFIAQGDKPQAGLRGLSVADYNNDGRMDIFAAHATQPRLYCQTASHTFEDKASTTSLLALAQNSWTGSWADYNRDGWLDLLVTRWGYSGQQPTPEQSGTLLPVSLLANSGGSSIAFSLKNGVAGLASAPAAASISAAWGDVDGDGLQDFVVGDLQGSAQLYMNQGLDEYSHEYWFTEQSASRLLGVAYSKTKISGLQWLDYDGDSDLDLAIARYQDASNCVAIMKNTSGILSVLYWPTIGLTTLAATNGLMTLDYDLNGRPDILAVPAASNGGVSLYAASEPGQTADFVDLAEQSGIDMGRVDGIVAADFNGSDGDPDLYLGRPKGDYKFFYKNAKPLGGDSLGRNYLRLKLVGNTHDNSVSGIGARVYFETTDAAGEPIALMQQVDGGSGRGIQQVPNLTFATGDLARAAKATVYWPNGRVQTNTSLATSTSGTQYTITEPTTAPALIAGSVTGQYTALPGEAAIWEFNWRTQDWSNPALDRVVVEDNVGQPPECTIGSLELRQDHVGVEVTVEPYPGGGFLHKLVWSGASCVGGCSYKYKVYSYNNGLQMSSTTRYLNIGACLH